MSMGMAYGDWIAARPEKAFIMDMRSISRFISHKPLDNSTLLG